MKKLLMLFMILTLGMFLACGNDEGDTGVSLEITTEDGIENFGSIIPSDPNMSLPGGTENIPKIQVLAYANGKVLNSNLIMNKIIDSDVLVRRDYFVMDIPAGRNIIFVVNAIDQDKFVIYSGRAGPLSIRPRSIVPILVTLKKVIADPIQDAPTDIILRNSTNSGPWVKPSWIQDSKITMQIYTRAEKTDIGWVPGGEYSSVFSYTPSPPSFLNALLLRNIFQLITVHADTSDDTVVQYGSIVLFNLNNVDNGSKNMVMINPSRAIITLGAGHPTNVRLDLDVPDGPATIVINNWTNPQVLPVPSGRNWFIDKTIKGRTLSVYDSDSVVLWNSKTVYIDFGANEITVP